MKKIIQTAVFAGCVAFATAVFSQTIPPYAANDSTSESIPAPIDKEKNTPCRPGCYIAEGGLHGYYQKGKYYNTDRTSTQYSDIRDSKGDKYDQWGIRVNPSAEFFMATNFAVGGLAELGYDRLGSDSRISIGVGPVFSYYFASPNRTYIPYISLFGMYGHTNDYWSKDKSMYWTDQVLKAGVKLGIVFMLSRQVGFFIDGRFAYERHLASIPPAQKQESSTAIKGDMYLGFKYFVF